MAVLFRAADDDPELPRALARGVAGLDVRSVPTLDLRAANLDALGRALARIAESRRATTATAIFSQEQAGFRREGAAKV